MMKVVATYASSIKYSHMTPSMNSLRIINYSLQQINTTNKKQNYVHQEQGISCKDKRKTPRAAVTNKIYKVVRDYVFYYSIRELQKRGDVEESLHTYCDPWNLFYAETNQSFTSKNDLVH